MYRRPTCAILGSPPEKLPYGIDEYSPQAEALRSVMERELKHSLTAGIKDYYVGMMVGSDMMMAELLLEYQRRCAMLVTAVLACEAQANRWPERERERFYRLLSLCDGEIFTARAYSRECYRLRNLWLAEKGDVLLAIQTQPPPPSLRAGKLQVVWINPVTLETWHERPWEDVLRQVRRRL